LASAEQARSAVQDAVARGAYTSRKILGAHVVDLSAVQVDATGAIRGARPTQRRSHSADAVFAARAEESRPALIRPAVFQVLCIFQAEIFLVEGVMLTNCRARLSFLQGWQTTEISGISSGAGCVPKATSVALKPDIRCGALLARSSEFFAPAVHGIEAR
jgi:hypothetical protein